MSYGIEIYDGSGNRTLGMQDFTYYKIFEVEIPAPGSDTSVYPVTVPGYDPNTCVVIFTPLVYVTGNQPGFLGANGAGFVPVYKDLGGEVVGVVRRALARYYDTTNQRFVNYHTITAASLMQVYKFSGG